MVEGFGKVLVIEKGLARFICTMQVLHMQSFHVQNYICNHLITAYPFAAQLGREKVIPTLLAVAGIC